MHRFLLLLLLSLVSGLPAQFSITPVPPFVGVHTEEFDSGFFPGATCGVTGLTGGRLSSQHGEMCAGPSALFMLTYAWGNTCVLGAHNQSNAFFGTIWGWTSIVFDTPVSRCGAWFGNVSYRDHAEATFYDSEDRLLGTTVINTARCVGWTWNGWDFGMPVKRIQVKGLDPTNNYSHICIDDMEYDPYVGVGSFGTRCAGALGNPGFTVGGTLGLGNTLEFTPTNTSAPLASLYFGFSNTTWNGLSLPLSLTPYGVPGCSVNISLDALAAVSAPGPMAVTIPVMPGLQGLTTYWQCFLLGDPSGKAVVATRGASVVLW